MRQEDRYQSSQWQGLIGRFHADGLGLGGWTLSSNHFYEADRDAVYYGDGTRRTSASLPDISTVVGAIAHDVVALATGPDGSIYWDCASTFGATQIVGFRPTESSLSSPGHRLLAQTTSPASPATKDPLFSHRWKRSPALAVGPDGSVYLEEGVVQEAAKGAIVQRVTPDGLIHAFAFNGSGPSGYNDSFGDYGPATTAECEVGSSLAVASDGSVYIACQFAVRKVDPGGLISTVFATDSSQAYLAVAVGADDTVYFTSSGGISKVQVDGTVLQLAGYDGASSSTCPAADGALALGACITAVSIAVNRGGSIYFFDRAASELRKTDINGFLSTVAGHLANGDNTVGASGAIATQTRLGLGFNNTVPMSVAPDGTIYIGNGLDQIRHISSALPGYGASQYVVPTEDGRSVDIFDSTGRHEQRADAVTGVTQSQFAYYGSGQLASITDSNGLATSLTFGTNTVTITSPYGVATQLALDANGMLQTMTDPLGNVWRMTYAPGGLLTSFTTPNQNLHTMTYDVDGRLLKDTRPDGASFTVTPQFGASGSSTSITTALGVTTSHSIQTTTPGLVSRSTTNPAGLTATATQTSQSSTTTTVPDGTTTSVTVGPDPRFGALSPVVTSEVTTLPSGLSSTTSVARTATLDTSSALTQWTEATTVNGNTWTTAYDVATRTFTATSPMGRVTTTLLDGTGRPTQMTMAEVAATFLTYDPQGRLQTSTQGAFTLAGQEEPRRWTFGYDPNGYPSITTDPLAVATSYVNDPLGHPTTTLLPDGKGGTRTLQAGFDGDSNQTSETLPSLAEHQFTYTSVDAIASYVPPSIDATPWSTSYGYDGDGRIHLETRPDGSTITYGYDPAGRLSTTTYPQGVATRGYDPTTGQLTSLSSSTGVALGMTYDGFLAKSTTWSGTVAGALVFGYDTSFRMTTQTLNGASLTFGYDTDNLMTEAGAETITRDPQNGRVQGTTLGGVTDTYGYDPNGALASYVAQYGGTTVYAETIVRRDGDGRILEKTDAVGAVSHDWVYQYDTAGRLTDVAEDGVAESHYEYDVDDNRLSFMSPSGTTYGTYDVQDRLQTYGGATYGYGANGELQSKTSGAGTTSYSYDVFGNLLSATLADGTALGYVVDGQNRRVGTLVNGTLTAGFLYQDQLNAVAQLDGTGNLVSRFVFGSKPNVPDYFTSTAGTFRILSDHLGSPRLVVNTANGSVVEEIDYDEFGNVTSDIAPGTIPFGFAGGLYDQNTGLMRFGARDYNPSVGRWTSKDPLKLAAAMNLYGYVLNDPVDFGDPRGLDAPGCNPIISGILGYDPGCGGLPPAPSPAPTPPPPAECPSPEPQGWCASTGTGNGICSRTLSTKCTFQCPGQMGYSKTVPRGAQNDGYECNYPNQSISPATTCPPFG